MECELRDPRVLFSCFGRFDFTLLLIFCSECEYCCLGSLRSSRGFPFVTPPRCASAYGTPRSLTSPPPPPPLRCVRIICRRLDQTRLQIPLGETAYYCMHFKKTNSGCEVTHESVKIFQLFVNKSSFFSPPPHPPPPPRWFVLRLWKLNISAIFEN